MPNFTLHRNFLMRTTKGHTIQFVKGQPVWVPPACVPDAVAIGAVPEETTDVLPDDVQQKVELSPEDRQKKLFEAFDILLNRNLRGDFGANSLPATKKLEEIVGFDVSNRERDAAWQAHQAAKAEE